MSSLVRDLRFAFRSLRRSPGLVAVAVVSLALGIAVNVTIFAGVDILLLRPLPFPDAERLVSVSEIRADGGRGAANPLDFVDWRERNRTFEAMAAALAGQTSVTGADGVAQPLPTQAVTADFFDVLGVKAVRGWCSRSMRNRTARSR